MAPSEPSSSCIIEPDSTTTIGGKEPVATHMDPSNSTTRPRASMASLAIPDDISLLLVPRPGVWSCGGQQADEQADEQDADDIEVRRWFVDSSELVD